MNWLDYVILGTLLLSTLVGVIRGITREVFGLGTWVVAFFGAFFFADGVASRLAKWIEDPALQKLTAYAGVFIVILAVGAIATSFLSGWIRDTRLSSADRTLGGGFGLARAVLLIGAGVLLSDLAQARDADWWKHSSLAPHFESVGQAIAAILPNGWLDALRPEPIAVPSPSSF